MLQYWFKKKSISSIYEYCFLMSDKYVFFILDIDFLLLAFNKRSSSSLQNFRHVAVHGTIYLIDLLFSNFLCHVLVTIWKFLVSWIRAPKDFVQTGYFQMLIHGCFLFSFEIKSDKNCLWSLFWSNHHFFYPCWFCDHTLRLHLRRIFGQHALITLMISSDPDFRSISGT